MKVFISWSGEYSRELAEALRNWLPSTLQSVRPFFTPSDIEKGARWGNDIQDELRTSQFGILCMTHENLEKPWMMFEAGALSNQLTATRVCPLLFGVDNAALVGPLVQFQATQFSQIEMGKLLRAMNNALGDARLDDPIFNEVFATWWPRLNETVSQINRKFASPEIRAETQRPDRAIMEEILELARVTAMASTERQSMRPSPYITTALDGLKALISSDDVSPSIIKQVRDVAVTLQGAIEFSASSPQGRTSYLSAFQDFIDVADQAERQYTNRHDEIPSAIRKWLESAGYSSIKRHQGKSIGYFVASRENIHTVVEVQILAGRKRLPEVLKAASDVLSNGVFDRVLLVLIIKNSQQSRQPELLLNEASFDIFNADNIRIIIGTVDQEAGGQIFVPSGQYTFSNGAFEYIRIAQSPDDR